MGSTRSFSRQAKRHSHRPASRSTMHVVQQGTKVQVRQPKFTLSREEEIIQERVMAADKQWFREHPGMTEYHREAVPGEVPRASIEGDLSRYRVKVTYFNDDMRQREFYQIAPPWAEAQRADRN